MRFKTAKLRPILYLSKLLLLASLSNEAGVKSTARVISNRLAAINLNLISYNTTYIAPRQYQI